MKALKVYLVRFKEIFENAVSFSYVLYHIIYWFISLSLDLQKSNISYEKKHNKYVLNWLNSKYGRLVPSNFSSSSSLYGCDCKNLPIWVCWLQGESEMPRLVRTCYNSVKRNSNGRKVNFVSLKNIDNYIDIPNKLKEKYNKGIIGSANYTDILRLMLLYKYGGTWIDSTIFLSGILCDSWRDPMFSSIKLDPVDKPYTISQYRWATFYIFSCPKSPAIECFKNVLMAYWNDGFKKSIDYFLIDFIIELLYLKNDEFKECVDSTPYNQVNVYELQNKLNMIYSDNLKLFSSNTYIYKLNRRSIIKDGNTVYKYLEKIK